MDMGKHLPKIVNFVAKRTYSNAIRSAKRKPITEPQKADFDYVSEAKSDFFTVGFGKVETVPDVSKKKYYIAGYDNNNPAKGVADPTFAHAVWIDDNSGKGGIVLVSVDCVGLLNYDILNIKEQLNEFREKTGCRAINIMSTHDHAGIDTMGIWGKLPRSGRNKKYMKDYIYLGVKKAVEKAYKDRRDGNLYLGDTVADDIQKDIRLPAVFSKTLTRIRFVPSDGTREIHMINFAAHAEVMDWGNPLVSADWPGYMRKKILEETGAETIFFNGAIGGMITPIEKGKNNIESTTIAGVTTAEVSLKIENERKLSPRISVMRQEFLLPIENIVLALAGLIRIIPAKRYKTGAGALGVSLKTELNYLEIDDLRILMLPGELFPELAYGGYLSEEEAASGNPDCNPLPLCKIANDDKLVIFGLANDEIGYILPPNDFLLSPTLPYIDDGYRDKNGRKHYEETNSTGPDTAHVIANTFTGMMETVNSKK